MFVVWTNMLCQRLVTCLKHTIYTFYDIKSFLFDHLTSNHNLIRKNRVALGHKPFTIAHTKALAKSFEQHIAFFLQIHTATTQVRLCCSFSLSLLVHRECHILAVYYYVAWNLFMIQFSVIGSAEKKLNVIEKNEQIRLKRHSVRRC